MAPATNTRCSRGSPTLDTLLGALRRRLGRDFDAYRNHAYRVANLCAAQSSRRRRAAREDRDRGGIPRPGHLDRWHVRLSGAVGAPCAVDYLTDSGRPEWSQEITEMILEHHKLLPYHGNPGSLVEPFRRADWVDVSKGLITFGAVTARDTRRSCRPGRAPAFTGGSCSWSSHACARIRGTRSRCSGCELGLASRLHGDYGGTGSQKRSNGANGENGEDASRTLRWVLVAPAVRPAGG